MYFRLLLTALAAAALSCAQMRIVSVEPTVLFPRATPLRQISFVTVLNDGAATEANFVAQVVGGEKGPDLKAQLPPGLSRHRVLVPDLARESTVEITLKGPQTVTWRGPWQPQRKWKVHVVKSSHEDLGYEGFIFHKQHDIANFIDLARELSASRENVTDLERTTDSRYHYTLETLLFQRNYIEERGERAWRDIVDKDLKTGHMHLMGAPSGVHSHWMDYEELARHTYPARRETLDRYGLDLKTYMIVDNPSLSWAGSQALAEAGFKYVARWGQSWRTEGRNNWASTKLPALFWWNSPNGRDRLLYGWRSHYGLSFWYGQTGGGYGNLIDLASENVSTQLKRIEGGNELGPYPYDALINPEYIDHDTPRFDTRVLPVWNERYAYPDIRISSPTQFFTYVERQYGAQLPELTGDLNNYSADYATIDPESQGWKRRAARLLPVVEGLAALASSLNPTYLLKPSFVSRTYTRFFDYDEHSWPTQPLASDVQLFNAAWVKKHEARRALDATEGAFREASTAFGQHIRTGPGATLAVFNPLVHQRTGIVKTKGDFPAVVDPAGRRIPCQPTADGQVEFLATDVPAYGYKLYRIDRTKAAPQPTGLLSTATSLSNQHYTVRFDATTGSVVSILEKSSGRELLDPQAPHRGNQMVYVHKNARESKEGFNYTPVRARKLEATLGPVRGEFNVWIDDEKTGGAIRQTVILYDQVKRIDFVNHLEHVKALYTDKYEERYRDNIYYSFPFAVNQGQFRAETAGAVIRPYLDQLRWGTHDYIHANRWVDISNARHGITVAPWNAATFSFGEIRYNQFSNDYQPKTPWLYGYAWSNRMAGLLVLSPDETNATLGYSLTSHDGDWNSGQATAFGWTISSPLEAIPLTANPTGRFTTPAKSFLSADAPNVHLSVLKTSEQPGRGWIARFVETEGRATEFTVDASALSAAQAYLCDLVENDQSSLTIDHGRIKVRILPYAHATVRFTSGTAPSTSPVLQATPVSDDSVRLTWTGPGHFNLYRSVDPQDPPTSQTLVARVSGGAYLDRGLHYQTRYYYRLAPVTATNLQGPVSAAVNAETAGRNLAPPAPVSEFGVVRRSKNKLMVYWRSNQEPDIARYHLYRGDTPDFSIAGRQPLAVLDHAHYFLQMHIDDRLEPGRRYYYKVFAEDRAGNRQTQSSTATAVTPN